jgi:hypothetical protein
LVHVAYKEIRKQKSAGDTEYRVARATSVAVPECSVIRSTVSLSKEIKVDFFTLQAYRL